MYKVPKALFKHVVHTYIYIQMIMNRQGTYGAETMSQNMNNI